MATIGWSCRRLSALLCAAMALLSFSAPLFAQSAPEIYAEANESFQEAAAASKSDPEQSRELFERAAKGYIETMRVGAFENGYLHYNAGNAYFLAGELGNAILNYRRAQELIPGDTNLLVNLAHARQQVKNRIELASERQILRILFFWHYDLPASVRFKVFVMLWSAGWLIGLASLVWKPAFSLHWIAVPAIVLSITFLGSAALSEWNSHRLPAAVITSDEVEGRMGPDANAYEPSFKSPLYAGVECTVLEQRGDWARVRLRDGRETWIPTSAIETV